MEQSNRIIRLIVFVSMLQFLLNGLQNLMDGIPMIVAWWLSGVMVAMATIRIEKYFAARRRFQR